VCCSRPGTGGEVAWVRAGRALWNNLVEREGTGRKDQHFPQDSLSSSSCGPVTGASDRFRKSPFSRSEEVAISGSEGIISQAARVQAHPVTTRSAALLPVYDKPMVYYRCPRSCSRVSAIFLLIIDTRRPAHFPDGYLATGAMGLELSYAEKARAERLAQHS